MGEKNILRGDIQTVQHLSELLEGLGLVPTKDTNGLSSASTKLFLLKFDSPNDGDIFSVRVFLDKRTGEGSVKLSRNHNGTNHT